MTNIITRYFDSAEQARSVRRELMVAHWFPTRIMRLYETADGLADTLTAENVVPATAQAYQKRVKTGGAVLLVRAGFKPLGVAKITRQVTAQMGAADMGDLDEEVFIKDKPPKNFSVLTGQPLMLTREKDPYATNHHMADWPIPLISRREPPKISLIPQHAHMANFPIPLISRRKPYTGSMISRHGRMANFLLPLISKRTPKDAFAFPRHARMAKFPIPLISRRKPWTGSLIGRHQRMANWPFPHLMSGKTSTNSLIPGGPRMANFPISLISKREPKNRSIFSRHARMANFPIPLISQRKPKDAFAFPRHARMADKILPLVIRRSNDAKAFSSKGFSLSKMLGLPTVIRR